MEFDRIIDRRGTESTKWDRLRFQYKDESLLPLWLADMDFPVSDAIEQALIKRAKHPIYGYTDRGELYYRLFAERFREYHGFDVTEEDVVLSTGVMYSVTAAINLFTHPGDGVMIFRPCYHPFITAVENTERIPIYVDMEETANGYKMDLEKTEAYAGKCKAMILCNPHNPTGRVLNKDELKEISRICEKYGILIISDEIHNDFIYPGRQFQTILSESPENTVCCVSPSKAFNLAGLKVSAVFIKNKKMKEAFQKYAATIGISSINLFAMEALKAAYTGSQEWQSGLLEYLRENRKSVKEFILQHKWVRGYEPEGTYFYWMHFKGVPGIYEKLIREAHVALNNGLDFHPAAKEYVRLNFACPREILKEALTRIEETMEKRRN